VINGFRAVWRPFVLTRFSVLVAGYVAVLLVGFDPLPTEQAAWRVSSHDLLNLLARWDAFWYVDIVTRGYHWDPASLLQQNTVFFPAYPALIGLLSIVLGHQVLLAGLLVSLGAFLAALVYLYRLASGELGDEAARATIWLLATYPFAVFFSAVYTESLVLLAAVACVFHIKREEWLATAAWGLLAGLTRPNGCLLSLPLAWLAFERLRTTWPPPPNVGRVAKFLVAAAAPSIGMLAYSAYLGWTVGEPMAWVKGQAAWGVLSKGMVTAIDPRYGPPLPWRYSDIPVHIGNALAALFALAAIVPIGRRLGVAYAILVGVSIVPPVLTHGVLSIGRFTSVLFPLFMWLAIRIPPGRRTRWLATFGVGQLAAAGLFFTWRILV
jgi:hypothetical protein